MVRLCINQEDLYSIDPKSGKLFYIDYERKCKVTTKLMENDILQFN